MCFLDDLLDSMQFGSSREIVSLLDYDGGFVRLQIQTYFDTTINRHVQGVTPLYIYIEG
jgi:hypothetical protein